MNLAGIDYTEALDICTQSNNSIAPLPDDRVWLMKTEMQVPWNQHYTVRVHEPIIISVVLRAHIVTA